MESLSNHRCEGEEWCNRKFLVRSHKYSNKRTKQDYNLYVNSESSYVIRRQVVIVKYKGVFRNYVQTVILFVYLLYLRDFINNARNK